jgi:hypothetical protein
LLGGLVFKTHRLVCDSALGLRIIKKIKGEADSGAKQQGNVTEVFALKTFADPSSCDVLLQRLAPTERSGREQHKHLLYRNMQRF